METLPAISDSLVSGVGSHSLNHRSCRKCNQRKTRCSKTSPCDNCIKLGIECVFPPPGRAPRRRKRPLKAELVSQLKHLEQKLEGLDQERAGDSTIAMVDEMSTEPSYTHQITPPQHPSADERATLVHEDTNATTDIKANRESQLGQLLVEKGTSHYVSHQALVSIENGEINTREFQDIAEDHPSSDDETSSSEIESVSSDNASAFLFGYHSIAHSLRDFHPSMATSQMLWCGFNERIAPLIMIFYKPVVADLIRKASTDPECLDKDSEALVFAVYFAAVTSMKPHQSHVELGDDHKTTILHYRFAAEQALARADFLHTHSLTVLQAAVLYLIAAWQSRDTQFVWTMTAAVYRVAQGLGLHRDGTRLGLNPFETEMRRRIWWHLYLLDSQASEHHATIALIQEGTYDTKFPLNINDSDISPDSVEPVKEQSGFTESTFFLIRTEITASCRQSIHRLRTNPDSCCGSLEGYCKTLADLNSLIESRYLQLYDIQIPIQWAAATMARIALARSWLVSHLCLLKSGSIGTKTWHQKRETLFLTAIEVVEFAHMLETNEHTTHWSWMFEMCRQWHAVAFILSELCVRPVSPDSDRAWTVANVVYRQWKQKRSHSKWILWRPLSRLMKRVTAIRAGLQTDFDTALLSSFPVQDPSLADSLHLASMWTAQEQQMPTLPATTIDLEAAKESMDIYKGLMKDTGHDVAMD